MAATVTIRDETTSGEPVSEWALDILTERTTVRELIRSRVFQEVQEYNRCPGPQFHGLVQPTDAEVTLNGVRPNERRPIKWERLFEKVIEAFELGRILVLVDDQPGVDLPIIRVSNVPYPERDKKRVFLRAIESLRSF